jgi:hypothetical protein
MYRKSELDEVLAKFPRDFSEPAVRYGGGKRCKGDPCRVGEYIDAWGCARRVGEPGIIGEVKGYQLADWSSLDSYQLPWELLDDVDFSRVDKSCAESDKFVLAGTETRHLINKGAVYR